MAEQRPMLYLRAVRITVLTAMWAMLVPRSLGLQGPTQPPSVPLPSCWTAEPLIFRAGKPDEVLELAADFLLSAEKLPDHPYWPKGDSGITIGVGWDLGRHNQTEFLHAWSGLDGTSLKQLQSVVGKRGRQAELLAPALASILVPHDVALSVFRASLAEDCYPETAGLFPGVQNLPTEVQVALLSVVFNRGRVLGHDPDWRTATELDRRWEMRRLQDDVKRGDIFAIYIRLGTMKRVWEQTGPRGLLYRRRDEQHLIRPYVDKELRWEQANEAAKAAGLPRCAGS